MGKIERYYKKTLKKILSMEMAEGLFSYEEEEKIIDKMWKTVKFISSWGSFAFTIWFFSSNLLGRIGFEKIVVILLTIIVFKEIIFNKD